MIKENPEQTTLTYRINGLRKVGWTLEAYARASQMQEGRCAICGNPPRRQYLDADHKPKSNPPIRRGLLCNKCNLLLGLANDDVAILLAAIAYVQQYKSATAESVISPKKLAIERALEMVASGMTYQEAAKLNSVHPSTLWKRLKRNKSAILK